MFIGLVNALLIEKIARLTKSIELSKGYLKNSTSFHYIKRNSLAITVNEKRLKKLQDLLRWNLNNKEFYNENNKQTNCRTQ